MWTVSERLFRKRVVWHMHASRSVKGDDGEEESDERKVTRDRGKPSEKELEEHRIGHRPFHSWCPHYASGHGTGK